MRGRTFGGRRTPEPPTSPPEPDETHREHEYDIESPLYDLDGVGVHEAEKLDAEPLAAVRVAFDCRRDGCDVQWTKDYLFALSGLGDNLRDVVDVDELWERLEVRMDHEVPYLTIGERDIDITHETVVEDKPSGPCHGHDDPATRLGI